MIISALCDYCGKSFHFQIKTGPKRKFCSSVCRRKADAKRKNAGSCGRVKYKKQCEKCLICFETNHRDQKYCSMECARRWNKLPRKDCVICGKSFHSGFKDASCCSAKCGKIKGGMTLRKHEYDVPEGLTFRERSNYIQNIIRNEKTKNDKKFKLNETIRKGIYLSLRKNNGSKNGHHWEDIVGYTLDDLMRHIKGRFKKGMSWNNHGEWHIDHKIPIHVFNFSSPDHIDFKKCWALNNLQPMWASDNFSKSGSIEKHFQPSLKLRT